MPGNTLFYAYVSNGNFRRLVVVFASRYVADEWWRAISSLNSVAAGSFQRISPQFYTHDSSNVDLLYFFGNSTYNEISSQFIGKLFITLDNDWGSTSYYGGGSGPPATGRGISIIPEQEVVDYLSGNSFYIRSRDDPRLFWTYPAGTAEGYILSASTTARTRFRVTAADTNLAKGTVLIGSDRVIVQIAGGLYVGVSEESGKLVGSDQPYEFLFGDLMGRKYTGADESELEHSTDGLGEVWELA